MNKAHSDWGGGSSQNCKRSTVSSTKGLTALRGLDTIAEPFELIRKVSQIPLSDDQKIYVQVTEVATKTCHDCGHRIPYHQWLELRCTLDDEDVTAAYCLTCFARRMAFWLGEHTSLLDCDRIDILMDALMCSGCQSTDCTQQRA